MKNNNKQNWERISIKELREKSIVMLKEILRFIFQNPMMFLIRIKNYDVGTKGLSLKQKKEVLLSLSDDKFIKKKVLNVK